MKPDCDFLNIALLIQDNTVYIIFLKTLRPSLWRGLHQYTSVTSFLGAEAFPNIPRKVCEAVPEGNCPIPQQEEFGSGELTLADMYRLFEEKFDIQQKRMYKKLDEILDEMRKMDEHVTRLEHGARQPRLDMKADRPTNTKTRERTEGAAKLVQAMYGDSYTAAQKVQDGPEILISFGVKAKLPALPCRNDVVLEGGNAASELCLRSLEMRSSTAVCDLVPTGESSTASETTSSEPLLRFYETEEMNPEADSKMVDSWTLTPSASYDSSSVWRLFAAPYCYRVVETKSRKIGPLIQAVLVVTSVPAHFWGRGGRWFVAKFYGLGQLVKSCSVFSEEIRWFSEKRPVSMPCQKRLAVEGGSRLHELEGGTEVTTSWRLEVIGS